MSRRDPDTSSQDTCNECSHHWQSNLSAGRSVPSGRVGSAKDATFRTNERFREAVRGQEEGDVGVLEVHLLQL